MAADLLFAALDNGDVHGANDVLDRHPDSVDARDEELRVSHYDQGLISLHVF